MKGAMLYQYLMDKAYACFDKAVTLQNKDKDLFAFYYNAYQGYKTKAYKVDLNEQRR